MAAAAGRDYWLPAVLGLHVVLLLTGIVVHSPTRDEMVHLAKGMHMWRTGRFDVYLGNPPLCDRVATAPLWGRCLPETSDRTVQPHFCGELIPV